MYDGGSDDQKYTQREVELCACKKVPDDSMKFEQCLKLEKLISHGPVLT